MIIQRCRICKNEREIGIDDKNMTLEMELCDNCRDKIKNGKIKVGRLLTTRFRKRVLGIW